MGVVTMNFEQRELIEELLDMRLKQDSFSNSWIDSKENTPEPFFIKNLEMFKEMRGTLSSFR